MYLYINAVFLACTAYICSIQHNGDVPMPGLSVHLCYIYVLDQRPAKTWSAAFSTGDGFKIFSSFLLAINQFFWASGKSVSLGTLQCVFLLHAEWPEKVGSSSTCAIINNMFVWAML